YCNVTTYHVVKSLLTATESNPDTRWKPADPNLPDANGRTPLMCAAQTNSQALVELLIAYLANANLRNNNGYQAADYTSKKKLKNYLTELGALQPSHLPPSQREKLEREIQQEEAQIHQLEDSLAKSQQQLKKKKSAF